MYKNLLRENEEMLEIYRSHEVTLFWPVLKAFVLLFIPWFFAVSYGVTGALHALVVLYTVAVSAWLGWKFVLWYLNVYIITTTRFIEVQRQELFQKEVLETPLERILNVSFRTTGLLSTVFGYGDVLVQVVGLDQPIDLEDVPNPAAVKDFLWQMHQEHGGADMQVTHTTPEIAPIGAHIPYAPHARPGATMQEPKGAPAPKRWTL
jgi:hypothetical protein